MNRNTGNNKWLVFCEPVSGKCISVPHRHPGDLVRAVKDGKAQALDALGVKNVVYVGMVSRKLAPILRFFPKP